jgi:HD-GYP domain-containing protein (c-di-GMP phosphodiesterase class II)
MWDILLPPEEVEVVLAEFSDLLAGDFPSEYTSHWVRKDGRRRLITWSNTAFVSEEGSVECVIGTGTDITERKRAEVRIERLSGMLRAVRKVNEAITEERDPIRLAQRCCDSLLGTRGCKSVSIALVDPDGNLAPAAQASQEERSSSLLDMLRETRVPECGRKALEQTGVLLVAPGAASCSDCPCRERCSSKTTMLIGLEHDGKTYGLLCATFPADFDLDADEQSLMAELAVDIAFALEKAELERERRRAEEKQRESVGKLRRVLDQTVYGLAMALGQRDPCTAGHQERVAQLACAIAKQMNLPTERIIGLRMAAAIHDVGKIHVPVEILARTTELSEPEFAIIRTHPQIGYDVLKHIEFPWPVAQIVLQHHERIDGSGYPNGLTQDQLLLEARILSVADVVEAMASHRPYRPALGIDTALSAISEQQGRLYDSPVVDICLDLFDRKVLQFQ